MIKPRSISLALAIALTSSWTTVHAGLGPATQPSSSSQDLEYEVKAQFLGHFGAFIEWPASAFRSPDAPFRVCILGPDPFGPALDRRLGGEQAGNRRIVVDRIKDDAAAASCQIVFVGSVTPARAAALHKATHGLPVLIVTDTARLLEQCAAIAFVIDSGRVRFDVSLVAVAGRGLKASPRLLRVARTATNRYADCD